MNRSLVYIALFFLMFSSCEKESTLEELEYNKYKDLIPNPIGVDSIITRAEDSVNCLIQIYFSFDISTFEEEWSEVDFIDFSIEYVGPGNKETAPVKTLLDISGEGIAEPEFAFTYSQYDMSYAIVLKNGRRSIDSPVRKINTPSF